MNEHLVQIVVAVVVVAVDWVVSVVETGGVAGVSVVEAGGVTGAVVVVVVEDSGVSLGLSLTLDKVGVVHSGVVQAIVQAVVEARVDRLGNNWDNSLGSNGVDSRVVVSIDTRVSGVAVAIVVVEDGGLDDSLGNSGDNGLVESWDNCLGDNWELVVVHTSVGNGGLDTVVTVVHGQGVSLCLSLRLALE